MESRGLARRHRHALLAVVLIAASAVKLGAPLATQDPEIAAGARHGLSGDQQVDGDAGRAVPQAVRRLASEAAGREPGVEALLGARVQQQVEVLGDAGIAVVDHG